MSLAVTYEYKTNLYKVVGNEEFHNRLQNDLRFSNDYFKDIASSTSQLSQRNNDLDHEPHLSTESIENITNSTSKISENKNRLGHGLDSHLSGDCFKRITTSKLPKNNHEPEHELHLSNITNEEVVWTRAKILLLINSYKENQELFRNSKMKNKNIWMKILEEFKKRGYNITVEALDRKFRNLKKTYKENKDKKNSTGESKVTWEYFDPMDEIFINDKTVTPSLTISSMQQLPTVDSECPVIISTKTVQESNPSESPMFKRNNLQSAEISNISEENNGVNNSDQNALTKGRRAKQAKQLYEHRKTIREIEKQRVEEITKLRKAIEESNKIQEERNVILRELLKK